MEGGIIMNIDQMLADPALKNSEKTGELVIKRFEFRLFKRLFRFDIIKEGFNPPNLFECDEILCDTDKIVKNMLGKELSKEEIERMYKHPITESSFPTQHGSNL